MKTNSSFVYVIDDDLSVRDAICNLLRSIGLEAKCFASPQEFLSHKCADVPSCLILDVRLPGTSGLEFQGDLKARGFQLPIVFITGHGDIPMSVRAMKAGATEFLTKPFRDQDLIDSIHAALHQDHERRCADVATTQLRERVLTLTQREREVMTILVKGQLNKQIGAVLGTTESTVKAHRMQIMRKMQAGSLVDLVRMTDRLNLRNEAA